MGATYTIETGCQPTFQDRNFETAYAMVVAMVIGITHPKISVLWRPADTLRPCLQPHRCHH